MERRRDKSWRRAVDEILAQLNPDEVQVVREDGRVRIYAPTEHRVRRWVIPRRGDIEYTAMR